MSFHFKQFSVEDDQSSMRIGTDAVLLGAWINPENRSEILDIGTGSGVIALMVAQKCNATITAIDIDKDSVHQASLNFQNSPWKIRMNTIHISFQEFTRLQGFMFDLIITNPPFFKNSLRSPLNSRNIARHDDQLNAHDLLDGVTNILRSNGKFCLILPVDGAQLFKEYANEQNLHLVRQLQVRSKPGIKPKRVIMEFSLSLPGIVITEEIVIRREDNSFTEAYRQMTRDFYLEF
jgi:tRNA1Val (adenine37-N6)-methyltransferase